MMRGGRRIVVSSPESGCLKCHAMAVSIVGPLPFCAMFKRLACLLFLLIDVSSAEVHEPVKWHFLPPAGSGVANVKDYGAKGDGVTDDTAAIVRAISENIDKKRYRANPFIYFPNGTYLVSDKLEGRIMAEGRDEGKVWSAGWRAMLILIGETREGAVIRLKDQAPGYGDPAKPKWLIATGSEDDDRNNQRGRGNRAFRHYILNLTVDVGDANPGAVAIDFIANNRGAIEGVTLRAGEGSGHTAIGLTRDWPGPAMVQDVSIEGFDHALHLDHYQYGMTFENIRMSGQRKAAVLNSNNVVVMRKVRYTGEQPFYQGTGEHSMLCLLDSTLTRSGGADGPAILARGLLNLRRVQVEGFGRVVEDTRVEARHLVGNAGGTTAVDSHDQGFTLDTSGQEAVPMNLPIAEIPALRPPPGSVWTYGGDSSESLQAAIDSGAEWIYLRPDQTSKFSEPVILRAKVKLIMGMHGWIEGPAGEKPGFTLQDPPAFIVADEGPEVVGLEFMFIGGRVENPSKRTLVLRHVDIEQHGLRAEGPGQTHVIDVIGRNYHIGPQHTFWARQLNAEFGAEPLFTNAGTSWILGFKMETSPTGSSDAPLSTPSLLNRGGRLEVTGGLLYTLGSGREEAPRVPAFTNERGDLSVSFRNNGRPETFYPILLRQGPFSGEGSNDIPLSAFKGPGAALLRDTRE
jgi:hypothetical protein